MPAPRLLDLTLPTPAENLALDEALLLRSDAALAAGAAPADVEILRFWESPTHFATLGVASRLKSDVDLDACRRAGVPVLRRASGGGTVLQGPGCLNFSLVLALTGRPELRDISCSYAAILSRTAAGLDVAGLAHRGTSDLAVGGLKISGNAQKRTRHALLHHGTVLHGFDISLLSRLLREPEKQPDYRERRRHVEFASNLDLPPAEIRRRIARAWDAAAAADDFELPDLEDLVTKHSSRAWTERF